MITMKIIKSILRFFKEWEQKTDAGFIAMNDVKRVEIIKFINDSTL